MPAARAAGLTNGSGDALGRSDRILVFPYPHDNPSSGTQGLVILAVALDVAVEFGAPVDAVRFGLHTVLRAAMPEAPIGEHCHASLREHSVGATAHSRLGCSVLEEPQAEAVQL